MLEIKYQTANSPYTDNETAPNLSRMNFQDLPNLASPQLGAKIIFASDEWFAAADNVIKDDEPVWKQDDYTPFGKWMDGWESRRRRTEGHDWCIIQLGLPGFVRAIEIDTAFFTGNFSPQASVFGTLQPENAENIHELLSLRKLSTSGRQEYGRMGMCASSEEWNAVHPLKSENWTVLVPLSPLGAGYEATRRTLFEVPRGNGPIQYLRLNMGPDGGISRIRVYGEVVINPDSIPAEKEVDLAFITNGGMAISCSNKHYGHPRNLILPGRGNCMGDGWETARQPKRPPVYTKGPDGLLHLPGNDWAVLQLGVAGVISRLEVDTHFYKGNFPESCTIEACYVPNSIEAAANLATEDGHQNFQWKTLLPRTRLTADSIHEFSIQRNQLHDIGVVSHLKLVIYPDGGVMRLRAFGFRAKLSKL